MKRVCAWLLLLAALLAAPGRDRSSAGRADEQQPSKEQAALKGHTQGVLSVVFSPDGKTLASASADGRVKLWDVSLGKNSISVEPRPPTRS
jgi:WD40 repeat protein